MEIIFTLTEELRAIATLSAGTAGSDPTETLTRLAEAVHVAVPSCTAILVAVQLHGRPLTLAVACNEDTTAPTLSSLRLDLSAPAGSEPVAAPLAVIFLSDAESAFDALARDLPPKYAHRATIDTDLTADPGEATDPRSALDAISLVDRAIGVLVERGLQPDEAATCLQDQATAAAVQVHEAARTVLASVPRPTAGRGPPAPTRIEAERPEY